MGLLAIFVNVTISFAFDICFFLYTHEIWIKENALGFNIVCLPQVHFGTKYTSQHFCHLWDQIWVWCVLASYILRTNAVMRLYSPSLSAGQNISSEKHRRRLQRPVGSHLVIHFTNDRALLVLQHTEYTWPQRGRFHTPRRTLKPHLASLTLTKAPNSLWGWTWHEI